MTIRPLLLLLACLPSAIRAQNPLMPLLAPWKGSVVESIEWTYRGVSTAVTTHPHRFWAMNRRSLVLRDTVQLETMLPDLPPEGELLIGMSADAATARIGFRLIGSGFCIVDSGLWPERDGSLRGRARAILPNESFYLAVAAHFDSVERKGRWDLVTDDGAFKLRMVFRAARPDDEPLPRQLTSREEVALRRRDKLHDSEPHCG